jgi:hypothetical protein
LVNNKVCLDSLALCPPPALVFKQKRDKQLAIFRFLKPKPHTFVRTAVLGILKIRGTAVIASFRVHRPARDCGGLCARQSEEGQYGRSGDPFHHRVTYVSGDERKQE